MKPGCFKMLMSKYCSVALLSFVAIGHWVFEVQGVVGVCFFPSSPLSDGWIKEFSTFYGRVLKSALLLPLCEEV